MSFFSANAITAGYGKHPVVESVSFEMEPGCVMGVLGANGSGKTTLLKALCGILPHKGRCILDGHTLETLSARQTAQLCSYIPQRSGISIDISALDVVLMGFNPHMKLLAHPTQAMRAAAMLALEQAGLSGMEQMNYLHMSEGQKQLCILARTLVSESRLLLLDEPESALDFRFRHHMLDMVCTWTRSSQRSALITLHDPMLALNSCDRLLLLAHGKNAGMITPREDSLKDMEEKLYEIYGTVSLHLCKNHSGQTSIVMLKEEDA